MGDRGTTGARQPSGLTDDTALVQSCFVRRSADLKLGPVQSRGRPFSRSLRAGPSLVLRAGEASAKVWSKADDEPAVEYEYEYEYENELVPDRKLGAAANPGGGGGKPQRRRRQTATAAAAAAAAARRQAASQSAAPSEPDWTTGSLGVAPSFLGRGMGAPSASIPPAPALLKTSVSLGDVGQRELETLCATSSLSFLSRNVGQLPLRAAPAPPAPAAPAPPNPLLGPAPLPPVAGARRPKSGPAGATGTSTPATAFNASAAQPASGPGALQIADDTVSFLKTAPPGEGAMEIGRQLLRHLLRMHDMPLRCAEHGDKTHRILQRFLDAALASIQSEPARTGTDTGAPKVQGLRNAVDSSAGSGSDAASQLGEALMAELVVQQQLEAYCSPANAAELRATVAGHFRELLTSLPDLLVERDAQLRTANEAEMALKKQLASAQQDATMAREDADKRADSIAKLDAEVAQKRARIEALESALDGALEAELGSKDDAARANEHLAEAKRQAARREAESAKAIATERRRLATLQQELLLQQEQTSQLDQLCKRQQADVAELEKVRADMAAQQAEMEPLRNRVREMQIAAKAMKKRAEDAEAARLEAETSLEEAEKAFNQRGSVGRLKDKYEGTIKTLREDLHMAKSTLSKLQREVQKNTSSSEAAQNELIKLRMLNEAHDANLKLRENDIKDLQSQIELDAAKAQQHLEAAERAAANDAAEAAEAAKKVSEERDALKAQLGSAAGLQQSRKKMIKGLGRVQATLKNQKREHSNKAADVKKQLERFGELLTDSVSKVRETIPKLRAKCVAEARTEAEKKVEAKVKAQQELNGSFQAGSGPGRGASRGAGGSSIDRVALGASARKLKNSLSATRDSLSALRDAATAMTQDAFGPEAQSTWERLCAEHMPQTYAINGAGDAAAGAVGGSAGGGGGTRAGAAANAGGAGRSSGSRDGVRSSRGAASTPGSRGGSARSAAGSSGTRIGDAAQGFGSGRTVDSAALTTSKERIAQLEGRVSELESLLARAEAENAAVAAEAASTAAGLGSGTGAGAGTGAGRGVGVGSGAIGTSGDHGVSASGVGRDGGPHTSTTGISAARGGSAIPPSAQAQRMALSRGREWGDGESVPDGLNWPPMGDVMGADSIIPHRGSLPSAWRKTRLRSADIMSIRLAIPVPIQNVEATKARQLKPVIWLLRRIEHVYDAKLVAEQADCREGLQSQSLAEELKEWAMRTFGVKALVQSTCDDIARACAAYRRRRLAVDIFSSFLEGKQPAEELSLMLIVRAAVLGVGTLSGGGSNSKARGSGDGEAERGKASAAALVHGAGIGLAHASAIFARFVGQRLEPRHHFAALQRLEQLAMPRADGAARPSEDRDGFPPGRPGSSAPRSPTPGAPLTVDAEAGEAAVKLSPAPRDAPPGLPSGIEDAATTALAAAATPEGQKDANHAAEENAAVAEQQPHAGPQAQAPESAHAANMLTPRSQLEELQQLQNDLRWNGEVLVRQAGRRPRLVPRLVSVPRFVLLCVKEFRAEQRRFGARLRAELANVVGVEPTAVGDDSDGSAAADAAATGSAETSAGMRMDLDSFYSALLATMPHWPESVVGVVYEQATNAELSHDGLVSASTLLKLSMQYYANTFLLPLLRNDPGHMPTLHGDAQPKDATTLADQAHALLSPGTRQF